MAQQRQYWQMQGVRLCPRVIFLEDLISELRNWRDTDEKLLLLMDANENLESGPLTRLLSHCDLDMHDIIHHISRQPGPPTFIRGTRQIDGVWATKDVTESAVVSFLSTLGQGITVASM